MMGGSIHQQHKWVLSK